MQEEGREGKNVVGQAAKEESNRRRVKAGHMHDMPDGKVIKQISGKVRRSHIEVLGCNAYSKMARNNTRKLI